ADTGLFKLERRERSEESEDTDHHDGRGGDDAGGDRNRAPHRRLGWLAAVDGFANAAEDEDVVVHREPKEDDEQEEGQPGDGRAGDSRVGAGYAPEGGWDQPLPQLLDGAAARSVRAVAGQRQEERARAAGAGGDGSDRINGFVREPFAHSESAEAMQLPLELLL